MINYLEIPRIFLFILGSILGSFSGVLISREGKESILFPPSQCDHCKKPLKWFELIPIFSFLILSGRCRSCQKKIPKMYFFLEILNGLFYFFLDYQEYFLFTDLSFTLLIALSYLDMKYLEVSHRLLYLFFGVRFFYMITSKNFSFLFLVFLLFISIQKIRKEERLIGQGDLYLLLSLSLDKIEHFIIYLLLLGLCSGVFAVYFLLKKKREIPFIPIMAVAFLLTSFLKEVLINYYFR